MRPSISRSIRNPLTLASQPLCLPHGDEVSLVLRTQCIMFKSHTRAMLTFVPPISDYAGKRQGNRVVSLGEKPYFDPQSVSRREALAAQVRRKFSSAFVH